MRHISIALALIACLGLSLEERARAQDGWDPFGQLETDRTSRKERQRPAATGTGRPYAPPAEEGYEQGASPSGYGSPSGYSYPPSAGGSDAPVARQPIAPLDERSRAVERADLSPVMAKDGSGLPYELWRGLDVGMVEDLIAKLEIPPRSPAVHALWRRLITAEAPPPSGGQSNAHFEAVRAEALYRSGLLAEVPKLLARQSSASTDPLVAVLLARSEIGLGNRERGCEAARGITSGKRDLPKILKSEAILIAGYCAVAGGGREAAGLAAELAREEGLGSSVGVKALDALTSGVKPKLGTSARITLIDYRLLELAGVVDLSAVISNASPALLVALAESRSTAPDLRVSAAEAAARINAIAPDDLANAYRSEQTAELGEPSQAGSPGRQADRAMYRAALFKAIESEHTPSKKARLIRNLLDEARRAGFYLLALRIIAPHSDNLPPSPEIGWYAETGIEVSLAAGNYGRARAWAAFGSSLDRRAEGGLDDWLALADIADNDWKSRRGTYLAAVESLARRGRFKADDLHRLVTVLDALDYNIPIPLWEIASRTQQPASGHLPETGVLSNLQDAAKKQEFGRTVLLVLATLGPDGAAGAHMIALGDAIRALKQAGLEADARRLGFEALFAAWPRSASN